MAAVLNRATKEYLKSVNTPDYGVDWIINPDLSAVVGHPSKYWVITGDVVTLMDLAARDAVDAQEVVDLTLANRAEAAAEIDRPTSDGINRRELIELINKRDNYLVNRVQELQGMVAALQGAIAGSVGDLSTMKTDVGAVDTTPLPTSTRTRAAAIQIYKDDINAGVAD